MKQKIFHFGIKSKFWIYLCLVNVFYWGLPIMTFADSTAVMADSKSTFVNWPADPYRLNPAGAKAAQAEARGAVVVMKPSRIVAGAIAVGTLAAAVRGDAGGTAGGLENIPKP